MAETMPLIRAIGQPLVASHFGDLHITDAKAPNYLRLLSMLVQLEVTCSRQLDFLYLPGDIADNGRLDQYQLVATALRITGVPTYLITGDHDMEPHSLANFYTLAKANSLPMAAKVRGYAVCFWICVGRAIFNNALAFTPWHSASRPFLKCPTGWAMGPSWLCG